MASPRVKTSLLVLFPLILLSAVHCTHSNSGHAEQLEGTQDSGGGSAFYSEDAQVNAAIDRAIQIATEARPDRNIFVQFWKAKGAASRHIEIREPKLRSDPSLDSGRSLDRI